MKIRKVLFELKNFKKIQLIKKFLKIIPPHNSNQSNVF